jgi:hypothetical protein
MGTLEALLTGREYDEIARGHRAGTVVVSRDGGQRLVVRLTGELHAALSQADDARLAAVAVPWSQTEEFSGQGDPDVLAALLGELAGHRCRLPAARGRKPR